MKNQGVAQTLLDHYRDSLSPSQQTRERMLREVTLRIASGSAPAIRLDTPAESAQAGPVAASATSPWIVAAVAAGATVLLGLGALWWRERAHEPTPSPLPAAQPAAPAPELLEPAQPPSQIVQPAPHLAPAAPAAPAKASPRSGQSRSSNTRRSKAAANEGLAALAPAEPPATTTPAPAEAPKPAVAPQPPASTSEPAPSAAERDQLAEELRLIRAAYAALQANKPDAALARVEEHAKKFPGGKLSESRDVARIMALCQSGKIAQGRAESARFLARSPGSAYASRVKTLCVEPSGSH